jgi:hypothetical protein
MSTDNYGTFAEISFESAYALGRVVTFEDKTGNFSAMKNNILA